MGDTVNVLYVEKRHAKTVKTTLEQKGMIHKDFRMVPALCKEWDGTIAIPIIEMKEELYANYVGVVGCGSAFCPYSTSFLGNHTGRTAKIVPKNQDLGDHDKTLVEQALLLTFEQHGLWKVEETDDDTAVELLLKIRKLERSICPPKLEYLGDDKTLVLHRKAFSLDQSSFCVFLESFGCVHDTGDQQAVLSTLWKNLAQAHKSPRVVRRGEIDPSSGFRESNYRLLWPFQGMPETTGA